MNEELIEKLKKLIETEKTNCAEYLKMNQSAIFSDLIDFKELRNENIVKVLSEYVIRILTLNETINSLTKYDNGNL